MPVFLQIIIQDSLCLNLSTFGVFRQPVNKSYATCDLISFIELNLPKLPMKKNSYFIAFCTLVLFTGCSSFRKLAEKDNSTASISTKRSTSSGKREFINGIEVTPGGMAVPENDTKVISNKKPENPSVYNVPSKLASRSVGIGIENTSILQLKYAIITDATVEKLTNIPLLELIDKWWGTRYCMGGLTEDCIDCSAFTQLILRDVYQINLPRTAQEQFSQVEKTELEDIKEGDLVFFNTNGKDISHVGVYLLNNKFVHAATTGGVMISDLNDKYWQARYRGAGRGSK